MQKGQSIETTFNDQSYLVTRGLDESILWTVWADSKAEPYRIRQGRKSSELLCECPDFVYRGKIRPCKHIAMVRRLRR
jgi:hypothetical protein